MLRKLLAATMFLGCLLMTMSTYSVAEAKSTTKTDSSDRIIQSLGSIRWGDSKDTVVKKLRDEAMDEARNDAELKKDRVRMQRAMKKIRDRSKKFEETYTELKGESNLEVSVVGDEFILNNNESFLRLVDARSQRYYFFYRGRLYKYFIAYNQSYLSNVDFEGFVGAAIQKYGRPSDATYDEGEDEDILTSVVWKSEKATLTLRDKQRFFGTFTMTFAQPEIYETWARMKERKSEEKLSKNDVSSEVRSLLQTGEVTSSGSAVTSIVGSTNVDLNSIIPKDKAEEEKIAKAKAEEEEKKKKKKKKKSRKKRKKGKINFDDLEKKSGDGLIIY